MLVHKYEIANRGKLPSSAGRFLAIGWASAHLFSSRFRLRHTQPSRPREAHARQRDDAVLVGRQKRGCADREADGFEPFAAEDEHRDVDAGAVDGDFRGEDGPFCVPGQAALTVIFKPSACATLATVA